MRNAADLRARVAPRLLLVLAIAVLPTLGACGKHEEEGAPDLRKPPPIPPSTTSPTSAKPSAPAPAGAPAGPPAPAPAAAPAGTAAPAVEVKVAAPLRKQVLVTADYTGQTVGSETVEIRARVEGFLEAIHFTEGAFVKKGDLLYEIDKEKMQQVVEQAEGDLDVAKAEEEKSIADVNRNRPLVEKNAISREEYETSVSAAKAAHARVDAAAAAVARAKINLGYATVRAPVDGLVGKTEVDVGNLVGRGEATLLTTISKLDPIYAEVRISETDMLDYQRARAEGKRKRDVSHLKLFFSDGTEHPDEGKIAVIDRNVDTKTGTLLVQVSFPNPDMRVRPGQFARVQAVREVLEDALLVPQGCVEELQGAFRVYVAAEGDVVRVKGVKTGPRLGGLWVISEGLEAADRVVVEGRQKVREGTAVKVLRTEIRDDGTLAPVDKPSEGGAAPGGAPPTDGRK